MARESFGSVLRRLRADRGLTQEELAARAGITSHAVAALERGRRTHPQAHTLRALADALDLSGSAREAFLGSAAYPDAVSPDTTEAGSVPRVLTAIIGRGRELVEVLGLLESGVRLLTIVGPSGVGKTRLALEICTEARSLFPDGVAFVSLAPLRSADLVMPAVAHSLGLREAGARSPRVLLREHLGVRRMLVVLDNVEHLLGVVPQIAALLAECDPLVVVATSRAPLRIRGEREFPLQPLETPRLDHVPTIGQIRDYASVRLFTDRARDVRPEFELTQQNASATAAICARLAGLPLAIELAAVRLKAISPTELLAQLDHSLPLLIDGPRDLPERQRTMRGAIAWSYDLLEENERALFRRLSVFAGDWTLEAAQQVGSDEARADDTLHLLTGLVDQSLVVADTDADGTSRYRLLEPLRQYAHERLVEHGEADAVLRRHARYYLDLAERSEEQLLGQAGPRWLARLDTEHDNLRAALGWLLLREADPADRGQSAELGLRLATSLGWFWLVRGHLTEGRHWLLLALERGAAAEDALCARARLGAARLAIAQDDYGSAVRLLHRALESAKHRGDEQTAADAQEALGVVAYNQGEYRSAKDLHERSLSVSRRAGYVRGVAVALHRLGRIALERGDTTSARRLQEESLGHFRSSGDLRRHAMASAHLALALAGEGDLDRASDLLGESRATLMSLGDRVSLGAVLQAMGTVAQSQGDIAGAATAYTDGLIAVAEVGDRVTAALCLEGLAALAVAGEVPGRAALLFASAEVLREEIGCPVPPTQLAAHHHAIASARALLDEHSWSDAWANGRLMTLERAVEYALSGSQGAN